MLIDHVAITVEAGKGGNGRVSFLRNSQTTKGGPDGGNGGNGGSVYVQGVNDILALHNFQFKKYIKAEDGVPGGKKKLFGRKGQDTTIRVPIGTIITDSASGEQYEITNDTEKILLAQGGIGGKGNDEFKSATNQTPRFAEKGTPGEKKELFLELKLIADVGLIGLPNAGKSSLLSVLTNAKPKIANYPFTTLEPNIGMCTLHNRQIALADIPGLIEGAHEGKGLGMQFLKHIEKTKLLLHCISCENDNVLKTYQTIREELELYNPLLLNKKEIVLLTKIDLINSEEMYKKVEELKKVSKNVYSLSIYNYKNVEEIRKVLKSLLE